MILNPEEKAAAEHLLAHYGYAYPRGGSFTTKLIELMEVADLNNRAKILAAFPEYGPAVRLMTTSGASTLDDVVKAAK